MTSSATLGYPRIGPRRELKKALEAYWADGDAKALQETAMAMRTAAWATQKSHGIEHIPSNDFSLYDQVLDMCCLLGAIPERFGQVEEDVDLTTYFAMARGAQDGKRDVAAMEMTKWFDTNYHYIVPELSPQTRFRIASRKPFQEFEEAKSLGYATRPVLLGPVSFLKLGKATQDGFDPMELLPALLPVYLEVLKGLVTLGAARVQIDEPCLTLELSDRERAIYRETFERIAREVPELSIQLTAYFGELPVDNREMVFGLPVAGIHLDAVRGAEQIESAIAAFPEDKTLSLGLIDGRNIWRADLEAAFKLARQAQARLGDDRLILSTSCSLLHVPYSLELESELDEELKSWLSFAQEKLGEIETLTRTMNEGRSAVEEAFEASAKAQRARHASKRTHDPKVRDRMAAVTPDMARRESPFAERRKRQTAHFGLPKLPTTTIGSFPQTKEVRQARAKFRRGEMNRSAYETFLKAETERGIRVQEKIGLDVLVHGEFERTDMVEYFGEMLDGFAFTKFGWVQSYGSRCVKPPVIFGDVSRPHPMTVDWSAYAQSLTEKPVKGMLTGPVTILQWSFVRNDQPRKETCRQIALAIRDEVVDLEKAGIGMIQIDEPALREGLPLRRSRWADYLDWASECFRLSASGVRDETQIHTHMCYSEFNDIIEAIASLDADVISIETSRSRMELLDAFVNYEYPNEIGPGVYDIHSPRVPNMQEMAELLRLATRHLPAERIWVNPDCGLKTRGWPETEAALGTMVEAARSLRTELSSAAE